MTSTLDQAYEAVADALRRAERIVATQIERARLSQGLSSKLAAGLQQP